jgi:hypothetical protein
LGAPGKAISRCWAGAGAGPRWGRKASSGLLDCTEEKGKEVEGWASLGIWPKRVLENSKEFSISYFDSNSNSIRISNEFYTNLKLPNSVESK